MPTLLGGHRRGNILEFYTEDFRPQPAPAELFRQHVINWFYAGKHLRRFEAARLLVSPEEEDLASHRMICSALITFGEFAAQFAKQHASEVELESLGVSVAGIESETRLLRENFRMFHDSTITMEEAEKVLQEAFTSES